jgi:hypothetical protein
MHIDPPDAACPSESRHLGGEGVDAEGTVGHG